MCGIFGCVTSRDDPDSSSRLRQAVRAMKHRGPDGDGIFEASSGAVRCSLGHTRLAIIDLRPESGQPMTTADGRYTITYNGEVYNFQDVRRELEALGARFRTTSDTEVVLEAFARWRSGCLSRLRGMFAFAVWDSVEGSVFFARDRLGIKPLYYACSEGRLSFASEVRTLLAAGVASARLSPRGVASYLAFGSVAEPATIIEGVLALPPGHFAQYRDGRLALERYWKQPFPDRRTTRFEDAVAEIRPVLRESVRRHLVADVPVGIFLSGGIDSSAIVALAAEASAKAVQTFTVTFEEESLNEAAYAAEIARHFGCDHHQVHIADAKAVSLVGPAIEALDQPSADGVNTFVVAKAAREAGLTVALSGLGGDEVFAGYSRFRSFGRFLSAMSLARGAAPAVLALLGALESRGRLAPRLRRLEAVLGTDARADTAYASLRTMFTPAELSTLAAGPVRVERDAHAVAVPPGMPKGLASADPVSCYGTLEIANYLCNTLLRDADAMSMAHGLEVRVPLLDHVIVEHVGRLPGELKIRGAGNKPLLTASVPALPVGMLSRTKMGFTLPFESWFRGPMRPWMEEALLGRAIERVPWLDRGAVRALWQAFLAGERHAWSRVLCVATLARWCEANGVEA